MRKPRRPADGAPQLLCQLCAALGQLCNHLPGMHTLQSRGDSRQLLLALAHAVPQCQTHALLEFIQALRLLMQARARMSLL